MLLTMLTMLTTIGFAAAADPGISLVLPLDCEPGRSCDVIKYVDHSPGSGTLDYACGTRVGGEHGYGSTSIALRDWSAMERGVAVRAAASGIVDRIRDGVPDTGIFGTESREALSARGCGNAVVLRHEGGWSTLYCHLRQGSVLVKPGQSVLPGDRLASVGLSGLTELPHLYFSVRLNEKPIDPFVGIEPGPSCAPGPKPLWRPEVMARLPYQAILPRSVGFATKPPVLVEARKGLYQQRELPMDVAALYVWGELLGIERGDKVSVTVADPRQRIIFNQAMTMDRGQGQMFLSSKITSPDRRWATGEYRLLLVAERGPRKFTAESAVNLH
jgi:hypothetical protein